MKQFNPSTAMDERLDLLEVREVGQGLEWVCVRKLWGRVEQNGREVFSVHGMSQGGVVVLVRSLCRVGMGHALRWRGRHIHISDIRKSDTDGVDEVRGALCRVSQCRADADRGTGGAGFPGILVEKYVGWNQTDLHAELSTDYILVTPKAVELSSGSWAEVDGKTYLVMQCYLLDEHKNEYLVREVQDC